jgi:hypothetical protein
MTSSVCTANILNIHTSWRRVVTFIPVFLLPEKQTMSPNNNNNNTSGSTAL